MERMHTRGEAGASPLEGRLGRLGSNQQPPG
jgi:hypothetical protein